MKMTRFRKRLLAITAGLLIWLALMCSPIGNYVAIATITILIITFFVIGLINVRHPKDKR